MKEERFRCPNCSAMAVIFAEESADPMDPRPIRLVCQKCGREYDADSVIPAVNFRTANPFPSPENDGEAEDSLTRRVRSKRKTD